MKAEELTRSQKLYNALYELGFDAHPYDIEEIMHQSIDFGRIGFANWLYAYTIEKISVSDAKTIYDLITD